MDPSSRDKIGLTVLGSDTFRPFYFYVATGLDLEVGDVSFLTATGASDDNNFKSIDPATNPKLFRQTIIDTKIEYRENNKQFYAQTATEEFERIITSNFQMLVDNLKESSPAETLERFFENEINEFRVSEIQVQIVDFESLEFGDDSEDEDTDEPPTEEFDETVEDDAILKEIQPVIDVNNGKSFDSLKPGEMIVVQSPTKKTDSRADIKNRKKSKQKAKFLEFSPYTSKGEGKLLVQLDDNVVGYGTVSKGSLLKLHSEEFVPEILQSYLKTFLTIFFSAMGVIILLVLVAYLMTY